MEHNSASEPDSYKYSKGLSISDDFVICRDKNGLTTAIYGELKWNLKPYQIGTSPHSTFNFSRINTNLDLPHGAALLSDAKVITFSLMYFISTGASGALSTNTIYKYFLLVINACNYCIKCQHNPMIGFLKLSDLFSNRIYLAGFVKSFNLNTVGGKRKKQMLHALLQHLNTLGEEVLGYSVANNFIVHESISYNQHPLIPARIYLETINFLTNRVKLLKEITFNLEFFMKDFSDPNHGLTIETQHTNYKKSGISKYSISPTFEEAVISFNMQSLFEHPDFTANNRVKLNGALSKIQYEMKSLIHLYTGMRLDEVNRLPYDCLLKHKISNNIKDNNDNIIAPEKCVDILSTTTKFTGFRKEDTWFAHSIVIDAVTILKRIVRGYANYSGIDYRECPLLISTSRIHLKNHFPNDRIEVTPRHKSRSKTFEKNIKLIINKEDYEILQASDPDRDFSSEEKFQVGQHWPFTTHQYRRSLAFYAANSGFVSTPSLMHQFKHLAQQMSKYYSRNNNNIKTIFGHYDFEQKAYVLPMSHIAYELQIGMSLDAAELILADLLNNSSTLHGKEGGYLEHARKKLETGDVLIEEFKEDTVKRLKNGEISYKKTFLGGCTNIDSCECSLLGEFAQCLDSKCAVIKSSSIDELISSTQAELLCYEVGSIEYFSTKDELDSLVKFKENKIDS
jgi:hypothetical protein